MSHRRLAALLIASVSACSPAVIAPTHAPPTATEPIATVVATPTPLATATTTSATPADTPAASIVAADLDGVLTTPDLAHRLPLAVSIDDSRAARPQSGFNAASIVWQAPADGYESRYEMVFQESDVPDIGPTRSARKYLVAWACELRAAFAHYGGDLLSLHWIAANQGELFTNLDGMTLGSPTFHRIGSREAPHNAYTSTARLWAAAFKRGAAPEFDSSLYVRPFRDDAPAADRGTSQRMTIPYNTVSVGYRYDPGKNLYYRSLDGSPQIDPVDEAQVTARTIVVLYMRFRTDSTIEAGHNRPVLGYLGSGHATVFLEGRAIDARWSKTSDGEPTHITNAAGVDIPFLRGRIFMQVVPTGTQVIVKG